MSSICLPIYPVASLLLCGQSLTIQVNIPGDLYRPPVSTTSFSVQFEDLNVKIDYPAWSTQHSFATESALSCAELGRVTVHGTYDANDLVKPEAVDFLNLCLKVYTFKSSFPFYSSGCPPTPDLC